MFSDDFVQILLNHITHIYIGLASLIGHPLLGQAVRPHRILPQIGCSRKTKKVPPKSYDFVGRELCTITRGSRLVVNRRILLFEKRGK